MNLEYLINHARMGGRIVIFYNIDSYITVEGYDRLKYFSSVRLFERPISQQMVEVYKSQFSEFDDFIFIIDKAYKYEDSIYEFFPERMVYEV